MSNTLYTASRRALDLYTQAMVSMDVDLSTKLPEGPKLFVANHPTTTDPVMLTLLTDERIHTLITEICFNMPVLGPALRAGCHVPVIAGRGREAFNRAQSLLREGRNVAIFPEGALSPVKGGVYPLRNGAARLALSTGASVVPVGIAVDPDRIHRIDISRLYTDGPYAMTVGAPVRYEGDIADRRRVLSVSGAIRHDIIRLAYLSGQRIGQAQHALVQPSLSWARAFGLTPA